MNGDYGSRVIGGNQRERGPALRRAAPRSATGEHGRARPGKLPHGPTSGDPPSASRCGAAQVTA